MFPFKLQKPILDAPPPILFGETVSPYRRTVTLDLFGLPYTAICDADDTERLDVYRRIFAKLPTVEYYDPTETFSFFTFGVQAYVNGDYAPSIPAFKGFLETDAYKLFFALAYMHQVLLERQVCTVTSLAVTARKNLLLCQYPAFSAACSSFEEMLIQTGQTEVQKQLLSKVLEGAGFSVSAEGQAGLSVLLSSTCFRPTVEKEVAALKQKEMEIIVETANALWEAFL